MGGGGKEGDGGGGGGGAKGGGSGGGGGAKGGGGNGRVERGPGMMVAPGGKEEQILRDAFESDPRAYFAGLHAAQKEGSIAGLNAGQKKE